MVERKNQESTENRSFHNGILVTNDQGTHFPIFHFDLVVIVQPDQSKWTPDRVIDLDNALEEIWDIQCEMISQFWRRLPGKDWHYRFSMVWQIR